MVTSVIVVVLVPTPELMDIPPPRDSVPITVPCDTLLTMAESLLIVSDDANWFWLEIPPPRLAAVLPEIVVPEIVIAPPLV